MTASIKQEALTTIPLALWDPGAALPSLPKEGCILKVHLGKKNRNESVSGENAFPKRSVKKSTFWETAGKGENEPGKSGYLKSKTDENRHQRTLTSPSSETIFKLTKAFKHFLKLGWEMASKTLGSGSSA